MKRIVLTVAAVMLAGAAPAVADAPLPSTLPPAEYPATVSHEELVTMDDGVQIGATVTMPSKDGSTAAPGRFPVILEMTPYGREGVCGCDLASDYAPRGFAFVVADVRGTGGSGGNLDGNYFSPREARDGYELVEHYGTQPWSNGKVGMGGGSYVGITQYEAAEQDPPHLAAIMPNEALADVYNDAAYPGGILSLSFDAQYLAVQGGPGLATANSDPSIVPGTIDAKAEQASGRPIAFDYLENVFEDPFYYDRSPITHVDRIHVPVFVIDGWRDAFEAGNIRMFEALAKRSGVETDLHVDPCTHKGCGAPLAPTDNPPDADNVVAQELLFATRYLTGSDAQRLPHARLYVQGQDSYLDATTWPPPDASFEPAWLAPDGALAPSAPGPAGTSSYFTNPAAGFSMSLDEEGTVAASPYVPTDQRLEDQQGLTWRTPPLATALTLAGPLALHLDASSSASDTDWFAKVSDVAPDGTENIVTEGQLRASLRAPAAGSTKQEPLQKLTTPEPLTPGTFYDFDIAIAPTAYRFPAGDHLQIRVTSDNLPNALPGTMTLNETSPADSSFVPLSPATNTIRFGGSDPSSLSLPVLTGTFPTVTQAACVSRRAFTIHVRAPRGQRLRTVTVRLAGHRVSVPRLRGKRVSVPVVLRGLPRGTFRVLIGGRTTRGHRIAQVRTYHTCVARPRG